MTNTFIIESMAGSQLLLSFGAILLVTCVWYAGLKNEEDAATIHRLDEPDPDTNRGTDLGLKGSKDWTAVILLLCLIAHSYSEVFPKHKDKLQVPDELDQAELAIPNQSPRTEVILTTDLSINGCRKILEQSGQRYSDEQVRRIKERLYNLCLLDYELFLKMKTQKT